MESPAEVVLGRGSGPPTQYPILFGHQGVEDGKGVRDWDTCPSEKAQGLPASGAGERRCLPSWDCEF